MEIVVGNSLGQWFSQACVPVINLGGGLACKKVVEFACTSCCVQRSAVEEVSLNLRNE